MKRFGALKVKSILQRLTEYTIACGNYLSQQLLSPLFCFLSENSDSYYAVFNLPAYVKYCS